MIFDVDTERFVLLKGTGFDLVRLPELIEVPVTGYGERGDLPFFGNFDGNDAVDLVLNNSDEGTSVVVTDFVTNESEAVALTLGDGERVVGVPGDLDGSGVDEILVVGVDADSHATRIIDEPVLVFDALLEGVSRSVIEVGNLPITDVLLADSGGGPRVPLCVGVSLDGAGDDELLWMGKTRSFSIVSESSLDIVETRRGASLRVSPFRDDAGDLPSYGASQFDGQNVPLHMLPADVDRDGVDELVVVGQASRAKLVDVDDGVTSNIAGVNNAFMSAMADLGGDGEPEAVFSQVFNSLAVLPVNEDGSFGSRILFANPNGGEYRTLMVADFDADGKDDVMMFDLVANEYHLWRGTGDASAELWTVTNTIGPGTNKADIIDLDGDEFPDLVSGGASAIEYHQNNGDGTFSLVHSIEPKHAPYWIVSADVDDDGIPDVVTVSRGLPTTVYFLDSKFEAELVVELDHGGAFDEFEVVAADFDGNGLLDVVASSANQGTNWYADVSSQHMVWKQTLARVFEPAGVLPASESTTVAASDLNGDGAVDIATASDWDNSVRVHWGTPDACAADLTGDGALNFLDISEFLSSQLDFDGDGSFNFLDISAYLQAYGAGCP
ncbi:MAG: VCBS repeat-containing protein [Phycisphaerales bacterium]|nr:VCBS repeat-containing protein [Phycisphaerales bacterium]